MKRQDVVLLALLTFALIISVAFTYYKTIINKDFEAIDLESQETE